MAKRKSFIGADNPALQFISNAEESAQPEEREQLTAKAPEGYKPNPLYIEVKSRRLQLILQPSLYERVKAHSLKAGLSVNEFVHGILDEATKGDRE